MQDDRVKDQGPISHPMVLKAKLTPPLSHGEIINRPRLLQRVEDRLSASVIVVHGPAGIGKTTLMEALSMHFEQRYGPCAWINLDESDNDPRRFIQYLVAAFQQAGAAFCQPPMATALLESKALPLDQADWVLSEIGRLDQPPVLFLDDFETIHNQEMLLLIGRLIKMLPQGAKLVIGSRDVSTLPLAKIRARGHLLELGTEELRFSLEETSTYMGKKFGSALDQASIAQLQQKSEGWITALQLAAMAMETRDDRQEYIEQFSGTNAELVDYLAEDLLQRQPEPIREFLLKTSILGTLNADFCNAVCGIENGQQLLETIEKANLFLLPLGAQRQWYRYHKLFAEFLRRELAARFPDQVADLHMAAAKWCADNERPSAAIDHALAGNKIDYAGLLADRAAEQFFAAGRLNTLVRWAEALPAAKLKEHPTLRVFYAWSLSGLFRHLEAVALIEELSSPEQAAQMPSQTWNQVLLLGPFHLLMSDRTEEALKLCERHLAQIGEQVHLERGTLQNIRALCHLSQHRCVDAEEAMIQGKKHFLQYGSLYGMTYSKCLGGLCEYYQGQLQSALSSFRAAFELASKQDAQMQSAPAAAAAAYLAGARYEAGQVDEAEAILDEHLQTITQVGIPSQVILAYQTVARIAFQQQSYSQACAYLERLKELGQQRDVPRMVANGWAEQARLSALRGDGATAERYFERALESEQFKQVDRPVMVVVKAQILLACSRGSEAVALLKRELPTALNNNSICVAIKLRALLALALKTVGETRAALSEIGAVISITAREGVVRTLLDEGKPMVELLAEYRATAKAEMPIDYFETLLGSPVATLKEAGGLEIEQLTGREFDVLRLLAKGCSNQAIADGLFVSQTTVKTHLRNIYAKLCASNRTEAVAKARQLGITD